MTETRDLHGAGFGRRITVETPEHVRLEFELAGFGSRAAAALFDGLLVGLMLLVVLFVLALLPLGLDGVWANAFLVLVLFATFWGYFMLFEALGGGRTPGKRRVGIRVVMDTGHPITPGAAAARNLVRLVDMQPGATYLAGLLFVAFQSQGKRLGDIVAGTMVVRDRPQELAISLAESVSDELEAVDVGPPVLTDDEFRLLDQFLARLDSLDDSVRAKFIFDLAGRFRERVPGGHPRHETFLVELHDVERRKRRAKTAARHGESGTRASGTADRFVVMRQGRWEAFRTRAAAMERGGIRRLSGSELMQFAADYREVAADLARAETYGVDVRILAYLRRVVSVGHNAVYGLRGVRRPRIGRVLVRDVPAAVYRSRAYVAVALALFLAPGIVGYTLIRARPELTQDVIPDGMIARAEAGAAERAAGRGYAEMPSPYLPLVATSIITNNIQVAIGAFAFGITAGIGTVFVLVLNGLSLGSVLGMFQNYGLADWLLTFVAGHGVLELTAIFMAGGAGLIVARGIIAPGDLTRRDALVVQGREAIRLVGAAALFLLLAGLIEGFLSASGAPVVLKLGVSAASAVLVAAIYMQGRQVSELQIDD